MLRFLLEKEEAGVSRPCLCPGHGAQQPPPRGTVGLLPVTVGPWAAVCRLEPLVSEVLSLTLTGIPCRDLCGVQAAS